MTIVKIGRHAGRWVTLAAALLAGAATPTAQAAPAEVEAYVRPAALSSVTLSPSGQRLALLIPSTEGRDRLAVMDLPPSKPPRIVAAFRDADITRFDWVNENRLVYEAIDFDDGVEVRANRAGTFAVNHDGSDSRQLIARRGFHVKESTHITSRVLNADWHWDRRTIDDGSDDVWVHETKRNSQREWTGQTLARLNTSTGVLKMVPLPGLEHVVSWIPGSDGLPAAVRTEWDGRSKLYWREAKDASWTLLQDEDALSGSVFHPRSFDSGRLIVSTNTGSGETAFYALDLKTRQLIAEPVVAVKGFDLIASFETDSKTKRLLGMHFRTDRPVSYWFDDEMHRIQQGLDAALPAGRFNHISCGRCESSRFLVVFSRSDTFPGEYYLYDRQQRKLESIGAARPWLDEASQGRRSHHRIEARDGLSIPLYVTHPPGAKSDDKRPAVVLVHGGPWVRGADLGWQRTAQFLTSRGYRVIEPEFRGSTGYGDKLFTAGIKQWGQAMQDDLADAVQWAVKQGLVDDKRVCIMGSSYGGYAALMGPIRHHGVYRCAISFAGVTDIELRYNAWGSDLSDQTRRFSLPALMGDPEKDKDLLRTVSPVLRASELKVPILLVHGAKDRRVPIEHAEKFVKAAKVGGVNVEYKVYDLEGHGWVINANEADYYRRVEAFLAKHLSAGPTAP